ncbi:thiaminase II [Pseudochelatococcus contaminans]|uniref:Aminopyrimidine aminohydrolase n=1 Tax=Pseudochelatococcus contaminans TaxID=1538103 RepID=A0A7W5Z304_9HYPH|nr:thiaminase II [Pseudochelatococcus contaminans]MBB3809183.1 thiaminase/transcriptional activator TenA [Pseudochelatococcus contaminans]
MSVFARLKAAALDDWNSYVDHAFIRQMEDGTLPEAVFQSYLVQDYLFLIQFARANALAIYKSRTLDDMRIAQTSLNVIMNEMNLHVRLCERWGLSPADLEAAPEHRATVAYTRYVLDCGASGDLLDLHVALAPCVIGYAEIGKRLEPALLANPDHPYREWISEYASDGFQEAAQASIAHLDRLAELSLTEKRFDGLTAIFAAASRLEADFWQMGYDIADERRNHPAGIKPLGA